MPRIDASNAHDPDCPTVGELLQSARLDAGLSQSAAARESGIGLKSIQAYEQGVQMPPADKLLQLMRLYGVKAVKP